MKKQLFFLFFSFPLFLYAQQRTFEINGGSLKVLNTRQNVSTFQSQTIGDWGYHFGAAYTGIVGKNIMLKGGIRWSAIKSSSKLSFPNGAGGTSSSLATEESGHIEIPILIHKEFEAKGLYLDYGLSFYWQKQIKRTFFSDGFFQEFFPTQETFFRCYANSAFGYQYKVEDIMFLFIQGEGQARLPREIDQLNSFALIPNRVEIRLGFTLGMRFIFAKKNSINQ
jgi:hypothetical protein